MMTCPQCASPCSTVREGLQDLDYCSRCKSVWFDSGELSRHLGHSPAEKHGQTAEGPKLVCPKCAAAMVPSHVSGLSTSRCVGCAGSWLSMTTLRLLVAMGKPERLPRPDHAPSAKSSDPASAFDAYAFPVTFLVSGLLLLTHPGRLLGWFVGMLVHECGHAFHAWLSGSFAIPTPFAVTFSGGPHNALVIAIVGASLLALVVYSLAHRCFSLGGLGLVLLLGAAHFSFVASEEQRTAAMVFGGCGSQLYFSTIMVVAFFWRMPPAWRWDFWRFPALAIGGFVLTDALMTWTRALRSADMAPRGSAIGGDGDLEKLTNLLGWTIDDIVVIFSRIGFGCVLVIGVTYGLWNVRNYLRRP